MTLVLKPRGKGNWRSITMRIDGDRVSPLLIRVGHLLPLGGAVWRICEVRP